MLIRTERARYLYEYVSTMEETTFGIGHLQRDVTAPAPGQQGWSEKRSNGRPDILFQYREYPKRQQYKNAHSNQVPLKTDDAGIILLSADAHPIKDLTHVPLTVSTSIPGWYMEAIRRLNPKVGEHDFSARMIPVLKQMKGGMYHDGRPTKQTLNQRIDRDRVRMRILPWPEPALGRKVHEDLERDVGDIGLAINSTRHLADLTKNQINAVNADAQGTKWQNAGGRRLSDEERIAKIRTTIQGYLAMGLTEESTKVQGEREKIRKLQIASSSVAESSIAAQPNAPAGANDNFISQSASDMQTSVVTYTESANTRAESSVASKNRSVHSMRMSWPHLRQPSHPPVE